MLLNLIIFQIDDLIRMNEYEINIFAFILSPPPHIISLQTLSNK